MLQGADPGRGRARGAVDGPAPGGFPKKSTPRAQHRYPAGFWDIILLSSWAVCASYPLSKSHGEGNAFLLVTHAASKRGQAAAWLLGCFVVCTQVLSSCFQSLTNLLVGQVGCIQGKCLLSSHNYKAAPK